MSGNKKIEEGLEHIKAAEKSLKTSLLKWRPDYEIACDEYSKAATCFRNAKAFEQCKDCLLKATECHKQNRSLFHAARCLDQVVLVCKEMGDLREVGSIAERACNMYQTHGSSDAGASSLDKAAKLLEATEPEQALHLFQRAAEVALIQDNHRLAAEYMSKVARLMVKLKMYDQATDALRREICQQQQNESYQAIGRLAVVLVLVQMARGDQVAAEKAFKEWGNYCDAPEVQTLEMLIQAYDDDDPDMAKQALNSAFIKHMDVEYARLARDLPLPSGTLCPPKPGVRENAAPSYVSPNNHTNAVVEDSGNASGSNIDSSAQPKAEGDDEDYEGGLC